MSKPRRRVTVDTGKPVSEESEKRKPSVFERLGPGGGQRKYEERGEKSKSQSQSLYLDKCRHWLLTGDCPFGAKCKFQHGPFIAKRPTKNRTDEDISDDLRLKVKGSSDRHPSGSESPETKSGSRSGSRSQHDKETKIKSTVVVKNSTGLDSDEDDSENSDNWDEEVLDYKKELELEKKRQEIQRALSQLAASEGEERENITIEKKVLSKDKPVRESVSFSLKNRRALPPQPFSSEYSESDSSPERSRTQVKKSPKKISPQGKKKAEKKKHKQKSPVVLPPNKGPRTPSPSEMGKKKEHKKKYDTEDDSPHKTKHKKMKKMDKRMDRSPEMDLPKPKKKHSPRIDKFHSEKPSKADKRLLSPDLGSPIGKRSRRSWTPTSRSRSRSRSITPTPPKKQKIISPGIGKEKVKGEKVKQKKKKGKGKFAADGSAKDGRVSPVRIKKKKIKTELPFPIKRDIEEDLPARHSDSPGSENLPPRTPPLVSPHRDKPPEREFFKGMMREREEERRESGNRKSKRKRSESPGTRDRYMPDHAEQGYKRKAGPSQDRKFSRKDTYGSDIDRPKHGDDRMRRGSPDSFRSEERSPTPTPSSRRNHSPDIPQRSRSRRDRDEDMDMNRSRDRRSPDERRMGKESRDRRDDLDPRGQSSSSQRDDYRERFDREEHRQDPRERFDERFQDFPERFPERSRFPDEREQFDPRDRRRHDQSFERGRENRQDRFDSRDRFPQDQGRMHQGVGRDFFGEQHTRGRAGRGRGRGFDNFQEFGNDRQSRRSEWEDRRRGEVFGQGRDWGDRHDMRRDMSHEDRFDNRRDEHRFDDRTFRRDDERQMGRDGRPVSRGNDGRSMERGMREGWRGDMREDRMGMRDERMRDNRMDDRRRDRHSPSPYDKRGFRDERFPHEERMFGREDRGMEERIRDERGMMDRGRDDRMRDDRGLGERDIRGGMDRGRDERGPVDRERGMMDRGRDERGPMDRGRDERGPMERGRDERGPMDRGRDGSVDERGRGNRGREDRMVMERGRDDRMRDEQGSMERVDERLFVEDRRQRDRGLRDDRRGERVFRDEDEERFREERTSRERGGKFERELRDDRSGREDRRREEFRDRVPRGESSPDDDRTPDRRSRDEKLDKEEQERVSRDGSPKDDRPRTTSSRSERPPKDKQSRDDKSSEKSSKDSRTSKDDKVSKDDRGKDERHKDEKSERRRRDERSPRREKDDRSPRREGKKEEKEKWPPRGGEDQTSDWDSVETAKLEDVKSKDIRKRGYEKEEVPLSPIPKRLRDVSPASSSRSRGSHTSRNRARDRDSSRQHRRGDSGSDKEDHNKRAGFERDRKPRKKDLPFQHVQDVPKKSEKSRSVSPKPTKDRPEDKADKERPKGRRRSLSGSSSRSKEPAKENKETPVLPPKKADDNLYDEDNISAIVSLGGKSSAADDEKGSDIQSIRSAQFSDWSEDDMADNILNQAEIVAEKEERLKRSPSRSSLGSRESARNRKPQEQMAEAAQERLRADSGNQCVGESIDQRPPQDKDSQIDDDMDAPEYEEISSDEEGFMEEETDKQPSIVNILDIDWSSLKESTAPKPKGSALQRFTPASIFSQIGVSRAYAGDELFEKIKSVCQKQVEEKEKEECGAGAGDQAKKPSEKFVLHDSVAAFHCSALRKLKERANLLKNIGSHRRALCARKDLEIRRKLCKVNKVFDQSPVYPSHVMDTDLSKLSIQLFRQGRDHTPDKKDMDTDSKMDVKSSA